MQTCLWTSHCKETDVHCRFPSASLASDKKEPGCSQRTATGSERSPKTTDNRRTHGNPCLWVSCHWSHPGLCGQAVASALASLLPSHFRCEHRGKAGEWGSMGRGPPFLRVACNELGRPLTGSLNRGHRKEQEPQLAVGPSRLLDTL